MASENAQATFRLSLEDHLSQAAAQGAAGLENLQQKLEGGIASLRGMNQALRNLKGGGVAADATISQLKEKIAAQKASVAGAQAAFLQLGGSIDALKKRSGGSVTNPLAGFAAIGGAAAAALEEQKKRTTAVFGGFGQIAEAAKAMAAEEERATKRKQELLGVLRSAPGPVGEYASKLGGLSKYLTGTTVAAIGTAAALALVTAATVAGAAALLKYGVAVADARRNELLHLEGLAKVRNFWTGFSATTQNAAKTAGFLQEQIDSVSGSVAIGRDQVAGYAEQLYRMGLRGGNLQAALQGVATTAAVQGEAQAQAFANWAAGANLTGQSVKALAADVKARLGGIAAAQMLSLEVQSRKLHESFNMLFSGLKLDRLLEGVSTVTNMFKQSEAVGRALKFMIETLFGPIFDKGPLAGLVVKRFFQGAVIAALTLSLYVIKARNSLRGLFGGDALKSIDKGRVVVVLGAAAFLGLAAAVGAVGLALTALTAPAAIVGIAIAQLISWGAHLIDWWKRTDFSVLGKSIVQGLVKGIRNGASWVWDEIKHLARGVEDAFKHALGISSPSRVFMMAGLNVSLGAARGIDRGRFEAAKASQRMGYEALGGFARVDAGAGARERTPAGPTATMQFGDIHVHGANSEAEGRAAARGIRQELEEIMMGVGVHLGARVPA